MLEISDTQRISHTRGQTPPVLILTGATASGKSVLSLTLAETLNAEIVCMDSMQVYKKMDIGTAKPTPADCDRVPHHLLDLVAPLEPFSTAAWLKQAESAIADIHSRGKHALFCGGTGLYMKALLDGLFQAPPVDKTLRESLREESKRVGSERLYEKLTQIDPDVASKIHPNDLRRIVRALEIYYQTGRPISELRRECTTPRWRKNAIVACITRDMKVLQEKIVRRTEWMFENGLVEETRELLELGCSLSHTAMQGLGYRECIQYIEGETDLEETKNLVIRNTRRYAKRQRTWFRKELAINWFQWPVNETVDTVSRRMIELFKNGGEAGKVSS